MIQNMPEKNKNRAETTETKDGAASLVYLLVLTLPGHVLIIADGLIIKSSDSTLDSIHFIGSFY